MRVWVNEARCFIEIVWGVNQTPESTNRYTNFGQYQENH